MFPNQVGRGPQPAHVYAPSELSVNQSVFLLPSQLLSKNMGLSVGPQVLAWETLVYRYLFSPWYSTVNLKHFT